MLIIISSGHTDISVMLDMVHRDSVHCTDHAGILFACVSRPSEVMVLFTGRRTFHSVSIVLVPEPPVTW